MEEIIIDEFKIEQIPLSCTWMCVGPPGCFARGTLILMEDGKLIPVEDIKVGDKVVGDDFTTRGVIQTHTGLDVLYRIDQSVGKSYVVNAGHLVVVEEKGEVYNVEVEVLFQSSFREGNDGKTREVLPKGIIAKGPLTSLTITELGVGEYFGFEITGNGKFLLSDKTVVHNSGKTTFMENLAYYNKHKYPVARIFIGTPDGYKRMCSIFGKLFVSSYYNVEEEKLHIARQKLCITEDHTHPHAFNMIDDGSDDTSIYKDQVMKGLFKLGSQWFAQLFAVGTQYHVDLPPEIRTAVSYVALFRQPEEDDRKKLFKTFGGICGSYPKFCDLMNALTGDYTCMIFKKRNQSNRKEDCIFYYRTKKLGVWTFGCKEYRDWNKSRLNKNYKEQIVI